MSTPEKPRPSLDETLARIDTVLAGGNRCTLTAGRRDVGSAGSFTAERCTRDALPGSDRCELHAEPGGIIQFQGEYSVEELATLERRLNEAAENGVWPFGRLVDHERQRILLEQAARESAGQLTEHLAPAGHEFVFAEPSSEAAKTVDPPETPGSPWCSKTRLDWAADGTKTVICCKFPADPITGLCRFHEPNAANLIEAARARRGPAWPSDWLPVPTTGPVVCGPHCAAPRVCFQPEHTARLQSDRKHVQPEPERPGWLARALHRLFS